jgi:hypothetical protein
MNPFQQSDVWRELSSQKRRRVMAALAESKQTWFTLLIPATVTNDQIVAFARHNLLNGFFERPARIITAVCARRVVDGVELRIGCSPHPWNVSLPAWGCGMIAALKMTFGQADQVRSPDAADAPTE